MGFQMEINVGVQEATPGAPQGSKMGSAPQIFFIINN